MSKSRKSRKRTWLQKWLDYMRVNPPSKGPKPYPEPTMDDIGKVLSVDEGGNPVWVEPGSGLPAITESDRNKVLVVDSDGNPSWGTVASTDIPLGSDEVVGIFKDG